MSLADLSLSLLIFGAATFFVGGAVKGIAGFGLPLVAVPILANAVDPKVVIALMAVPVLASNLWLSVRGGRLGEMLRRFWPLLVTMVLFTVVGAQLLAWIDAGTASLLLGLAVLLFCASQIMPAVRKVPPRLERWLSPVVGGVAGLIGGISNFFGPVLIAYLIALRLPKDAFVSSLTLFFVVSAFPLYGTLAVGGILDREVLLASMAATVVVFIGVAVGARLRRIIPEDSFRKALFVILALIAFNLIRRGLVA